MKKAFLTIALIGVAAAVSAQTYTDINESDYTGPTDQERMAAAIDANFDQIGDQSQGAISTNGNTVAEIVGVVHRSRFTFNNTMTATDGSAEGESSLLYTFPEGRIYILGVAIDATVVNTATEADTNDTFVMAIGTAAAADDATLTSTEADIIASTTFSDGAVTLTNAWEADFTAGADTVFDGTASAVTLNLNAGIADANITTNDFTVTVTGSGNVFWINLGDD